MLSGQVFFIKFVLDLPEWANGDSTLHRYRRLIERSIYTRGAKVPYNFLWKGFHPPFHPPVKFLSSYLILCSRHRKGRICLLSSRGFSDVSASRRPDYPKVS